MNLQQFIDESLEDCVVERMRSNRDRSAVDHMEMMILKELSSNRFDNKTFYTVSDTIAKSIDDIEDTLRVSIDRNPGSVIHPLLDVLVAKQIRDNGDLDRLSDNDYYWVEDQIKAPLYSLIYGESRRGRDRGGYRDERRGSPYRDNNSRSYNDRGYDDRYSNDNRRGNPYSQPVENNWNSRRDSFRNNSYGYQQQEDPRRAFSENDGYNKLAQMRAQQAAKEAPQREVVNTRGYARDVEENVSYEPIDNPRDTYREEPRVSEEAVRNQERFEEQIRGSATTNVDRQHQPDGKTVVLVVPPADRQGYDHTTEHPYEEFWENDRKWQASVKTKWKLSGVGVETFPQLYNIFKYVSYHVMDKYGHVTQEFKEVNDNNRYINQSLLKDPDNYANAFGRKPPKLSNIMNDTREVEEKKVPDSGLELEDCIDLNQEDLDNLGNIRASENLATSAIEARTKLEKGRKSSVSLFMLMDPVEGTSRQEADLIKELYTETTLISLSKRLGELEGVISKPLFEKLNKKIGDAVIAEANNAFGLNIVTMNFSKHWASLIKKLASDTRKYTPEWLDNFSQMMNAMIPTFLGVVDVLDGDGEINPVFEHIITDDNKNRVIPFVNFYTLVSLDCTLDQMSIGKQLELTSPVIIRAGGNFYGAEILHAVMNRVESETGSPMTRVMLSTRCGSMVEVRRQELRSVNLVLSLYKQ